MPQIVVNKYGVIGITWYDFGNDATGRTKHLRFTASLDGGKVWVPSVRVSDHDFTVKNPPQFAISTTARGGGRRRENTRSDALDVSVVPSPRSYYLWNSWPGDYTGMAVGADGVFHAFWISNSTEVGELYTASVKVTGAVAPHDAEFKGLVNVTSALEMQYTSSVWDWKTKTVTLEYQFLNTSNDTIADPLKASITEFKSDLGVPMLVPASGQGGAGTMLDLSHLIPAQGLAPGQTSKTERMQIKFDHVNELQVGDRDVVNMKLVVYGVRRK